MSFEKITEKDSIYRHLEEMTLTEILTSINNEDKKVADAVKEAIPQLEKLIDIVSDKLISGGRLFYIGAGTSGRLGVLDASECVPTFGVPKGLVIGIIAGGDQALHSAVEFAEDDLEKGWQDLQAYDIAAKDMVIGLSASGSTPYVMGALSNCRSKRISTGSICCNPGSPISHVADHAVEIIVGPEFLTGSTRMKSGTAQKMALNMITTASMIRLGRVEDNKMVHMQLTNNKLIARGVEMIMKALGINDPEKAKSLLEEYGSVKKTILALKPEN